MSKLIRTAAVSGLIAAGTVGASAQSTTYRKIPDAAFAAPAEPASAFFIGLGGSGNTVDFGNQSVYAIGTSNVYTNGVQTSSGSAAGPANILMSSQSLLAPVVQGGFFQRIPGSEWMWGAKFSYSYLNATANVRNALLPQAGSFTPTGGTTPTPFTGNALVQSYQTKLEHQINFVPFVGHAFDRSFVYAGAGPTLSRARTDLNGLIGFADITGTPSDVSGTPINLTASSWVWGGAAMVGASYFLDRSWFLDFNYTWARTASQNSRYFSPFSNPNGTNGTTILGTLNGTTAQQVTTQAVTVSINRAFDFR
jgi:opacity protein-like surface antigen